MSWNRLLPTLVGVLLLNQGLVNGFAFPPAPGTGGNSSGPSPLPTPPAPETTTPDSPFQFPASAAPSAPIGNPTVAPPETTTAGSPFQFPASAAPSVPNGNPTVAAPETTTVYSPFQFPASAAPSAPNGNPTVAAPETTTGDPTTAFYFPFFRDPSTPDPKTNFRWANAEYFQQHPKSGVPYKDYHSNKTGKLEAHKLDGLDDWSKIVIYEDNVYVLHPVQTRTRNLVYDPYTIGQVLGYLYELNEFQGQRPRGGYTIELMGKQIPQRTKRKRSPGTRPATLVFTKKNVAKKEVESSEERKYWKEMMNKV